MPQLACQMACVVSCPRLGIKNGGSGNGFTFTFAFEEACAVLSRKCEGLWKLSDELDDLRDVILILAIPRPRLWVKEVIPASEEFK